MNLKELTLFNSSDVLEIAERAIFIPLMCNVHQMQVEMNLCINEDRHTGEVYAIAHAGQFTNDDKAYVYYDTPEYVVANGDSVLPVQMNNCKILNGSSIYCFAKMTTRCNVFTMESCQILARKVGENFTFTRNFGSAKIIATTESVRFRHDNVKDDYKGI
uniref:Acetyltransferase n=1 Tax=Heterorhabditis bacteriophora TaxID=37862 RepID=A0A1I7XD67_HETBA